MPLTTDARIDLLERMLLVRRFEERAGQQYGLGKINGFCHLYIGQEAVAVGCLTALDKDDVALSGYREHGHALARGTPARKVMAELFGKATGTSKGKGGSMHIFDVEHGFLGGYGIVGGQVPLALGYAFASKYRATAKPEGKGSPLPVAMVFLGDAAANQGVFYECLNMAALWKLPLVLVVENNGYGMGTAVARASAQTDFHRRGEGLGVSGVAVDGMDAVLVRECAEAAIASARAGTPTIVEARTYRYRGHSMADPATYRTKEELEDYRKRDPILSLKDKLEQEGAYTDEAFKRLEARVKAEVDDAVKFADDSPLPDNGELVTDIYAQPIGRQPVVPTEQT